MKILVVGAGPTGLMMAGELRRHGVDCRIVDRNEGPAQESRALGVQARTIQIFDTIGLADGLLDRGQPIREGHVVIDGKEIAELDFTCIPGKFNYILACPQSGTEQILSDRLSRQGIPIERNIGVTEVCPDADGVDVQFANGEKGRYDYVLGCDGAHSIVRKALDLKFEGDELPQGFILADVMVDWDRPEGMYLLAHEKGFLAMFPLPGDRWRLIGTGPADAQTKLEFWEVERMFAERSPYGGKVRDPVWLSRFTIHERIVDRLREGRCFVVGDAAHLHSPAGGQGMNTGLQDAHNLAWKLALVARGLAKEPLLNSYHAERYPVDHQVVAITRTLMHGMAFGGPVVSWIRDHIAPHIIAIPPIRHKLMKTVSEQSVAYTSSDIVGIGGGHWADVSPLPGDARHLLIGKDAVRLAAEHSDLCEGRDSDEDLRIIRPDGYIGAVGPDALGSYFRGLGISGF